MVKEQIWLRSKDGDVIVQTGQVQLQRGWRAWTGVKSWYVQKQVKHI